MLYAVDFTVTEIKRRRLLVRATSQDDAINGVLNGEFDLAEATQVDCYRYEVSDPVVMSESNA